MVVNLEKHRDEIRRLVADAPDEPTYCEFKEQLSYTTQKEKGKLVKDVSSFANADLKTLGGYGYLIFGVSNEGEVVGIKDLVGDPSSDTRKIVNIHLGRPVNFEYLTCEVDDKAGGRKKVAAIVVPDSRRRPHVASKEIKEQQGNKAKFWLREGEVWVRKTGGRELATAEDYDALYEGKLRRLVEDEVRPLRDTLNRLEQDIADIRLATPKVSFGFAMSGLGEPAREGSPVAVVGNLITASFWDEVQQSLKMAQKRGAAHHTQNVMLSGNFPDEYGEYATQLRDWIETVKGLLLLGFTLSNTGQSTAEDVEVVLEVPTVLRASASLPEKPDPPTNALVAGFREPPHLNSTTKENSPDSLIAVDC